MPTQKWKSHRPLPTTTSTTGFFPAKQIVKDVWIGSEGDSASPEFFRKHGIRLLVNASANIPMRVPSGVRTYRVPLDDDPAANATMLLHFPVVVPLIDEAVKYGEGVLVHCRAGMQRSASVVAAYLMYKRRIGAAKAMELINAKKPETFWPAPTFCKALYQWEKDLGISSGENNKKNTNNKK